MEIKITSGGSSKGQLMSITSLAFVMLMVSALLVFIVIGISYDNVSQSSIVSTGAGTYGLVLQRSADSFAFSSGTAALQALYSYSSNSFLRKDNFIGNFSAAFALLVQNGTLPGITAGSTAANQIQGFMSGSTLAYYNSTIASSTASGSRIISIEESTPLISQSSPYAISMSYVEHVAMNISSSKYSFDIPVNVSIPINNTPDLYLAQQGVYQPIVFANSSAPAQLVGGSPAQSGNTVGFVYGTAFVVPTESSCVSTGFPSSPLSSQPYSSRIIIVTQSATQITGSGCTVLNSYGGLITSSITNAPGMPYLVYSASSNVISHIQTGQKILLYGPGLSTLNISGLVSAASSRDYFTSPFAPSYISRSSGNLQQQSAYGIFTFPTVAKQAAALNPSSSLVSTEAQPAGSTLGYTEAGWIYPSSGNGIIISSTDLGVSGTELVVMGVGDITGCSSGEGGTGSIFFGDDRGGTFIGSQSTQNFPTNSWYFVAGTFNAITSEEVDTANFILSVNGNVVPTTNWCDGTGTDTAPLAGGGTLRVGAGYNGMLANLQIYDTPLTQYQINQLYQRGIEGLPLSNGKLVGWYTLNGNASDYSGNGYSVTPSGISYGLLPNYTRDSVFPASTYATTYPVPGLLSCNTKQQCFSTAPHAYLASLPLGINNYGLSTADFNGQSSWISIPNNNILDPTNQLTLSAWVYVGNFLQSPENGIVTKDIPSTGSITNPPYALQTNGIAFDFLATNAMNDYATAIGPAGSSKTWYYVAGTYGSNTMTIYVNGVAEATNSLRQPLAQTSNTLNIGQQKTSLGGYFRFLNGSIADVQLYNVSLSAAAINTLYHEGITGAPITYNGLMGWWPLNGNANDYSGFRNNANSVTAVSYPLLISNSSTSNQVQSANSIGLPSVSVINSEWQALGFPAPP